MSDLEPESEELISNEQSSPKRKPASGQQTVEEVMNYRTYCCVIAALLQKPTAALVLNLKLKKECKMDLPGRYVDFGALSTPLLPRKIPTN